MYVDAGFTIAQIGARAASAGRAPRAGPVTKVLFSTDAYRLPELYLTGAAQFRHSHSTVLDGWVAEGAMADDDAERVALLVAAETRGGCTSWTTRVTYE